MTKLISVIQKLQQTKDLNEYSCDFTSSQVKPIHIPIQAELNKELRAMAMVLNRDPNCLAADLLTAAIQDARQALQPEIVQHIEEAKQVMERAQLPENQPGMEFDAGRT